MKPRHNVLRFLCGLAASAWLLPTAHAAAGRTAGSLDVSATGAATYTIPIWVPPGPRGVQPGLALVYNSREDDGTMGPGWSLAGLSAITRCAKTVAQDGSADGVKFTYADRFCLNGNRLRLTSSANLADYGLAGTTYQTELADFSLITANGAAGNGPASFTVKGKDGWVYEYGVTADSRVTPCPAITSTCPIQNYSPTSWLVNKVSDRSGNQYIVSYVVGAGDSSGVKVPEAISYTRNSSGASTYSYTVNFTYVAEDAAGSEAGYITGFYLKNANRLSTIAVKYGATVVRQYNLTYTASPTTARYRLHSVQECADSIASDCLTPTNLTYSNGATGVLSAVSTGLPGSVIGLRDLNGDGRMDLVLLDGTTIKVAFANGNGFGSAITVVSSFTASSRMIAFGDIVGNGKQSMVLPVAGVYVRYSWDANSQAFVSSSTTFSEPANAYRLVMADINGDGLSDLIPVARVSPTSGSFRTFTLTVYSRLNTSTSETMSFSPTQNTAYSNSFLWKNSGPIYIYDVNIGRGISSATVRQDFNNDGKEDLTLVSNYITSPTPEDVEHVNISTVLLSNGVTFSTGASLDGDATDNIVATADMNSDRCTDIVLDGYAVYGDCTGQSFSYVWAGVSGTAYGALDWDNDGRMDILVNNNGYIGIQVATGNGSVIPTGIPLPATTTFPYTSSFYVADINGDGQADLGAWDSPGNRYYLHDGAVSAPTDALVSVVDGLDITTSIVYATTATGGIYQTGVPVSAPEAVVLEPITVVSQAAHSDGIGGTYQRSYSYAGAIKNTQRSRFQGFQYVGMTDSRADAPATSTYFHTVFPLTGMVNQQDVLQHNGSTLISRTTYTPSTQVLASDAGFQRTFLAVASSSQQEYEVGGAKNGQLITTTASTFTHKTDSTGNLETLTTSITDNDASSPYSGQIWTSTTTHTYPLADIPNWCFGLPSQTTVTNAVPGQSQLIRKVDYTNDTVKCRVKDETVEKANVYYEARTAYTYDDDPGVSAPDFGNVVTVTVTGAGISARTTTLEWTDASRTTGQFLLKSTNPLGHVSQWDYHYARGVPASATDPNTLVTSWLYDTFARRTRETRPDGTYTQTDYANCDAGNGYCGTSDLRFHVTAIQYPSGGGTPISVGHRYMDGLDRTRIEDATGFNGQLVHRYTTYDARGRVYKQAVPYTATAYESTFTSDAIGRVTQVSRPISAGNGNAQTTSIAYEGRTTRVIDALGKQTTKISQVTGNLGRSQDQSGYYQNFGYDAFGSLVSVTDSASKTLFTASYDYGIDAFQRTRSDPDLGAWQYTYTALGELSDWIDAKNQSFSMQYDTLSRPDYRIEPGLNTDWVWGNSASSRNIGQLASVSMTGGHAESFTFDTFGRLQTRQITQPDASYQFDYSYHEFKGDLETVTYPVSTSSYRLKLKYESVNGFLQKISDFNNSSSTFWQANTVNPFGQVTQATFGGSSTNLVTNRAFDAVTGLVSSIQSGIGGGTGMQNEGYLFNRVGSLEQRQNNSVAGLTENFYYDPNVHRLEHSTLINPANPGGYTNLSISYNDAAYNLAGRIASRSDVANGAAWTYHATKLHAVTQAGTGGPTYSYDDNGNALTRNATAIAWTPFNKPSTIAGDGENIQFFYNHDHERWRVYYTGPGGSQSTYFIGGLLEKVIEIGGETDYRHLIYAGGEQVAIVSRESNGTNKTWYLLADHLGSMVGVVDETGTLQVKTSYGAYGLTRSSCTWDKPLTSSNQSKLEDITDHGYTWHTTLGKLGLIDMQGRIQDAVTGRFLSPDPFITQPGNTQNFDRYAYTYNNPLSYTDPSGYITITGSRIPGVVPSFYSCSGNCGVTSRTTSGSFNDPNTGDAWDTYTEDYFDANGRAVYSYSYNNKLWTNLSGGGPRVGSMSQVVPMSGRDIGVDSLAGENELNEPMFEDWQILIPATMFGTMYDDLVQRLPGSLQPLATVVGMVAGPGGVAKGIAKQLTKIERQLAEHGRRSVEKSLRSLESRLAKHKMDLENYRVQGGYTTSVEREMRAFQAEIQAIKDVLGRNP